MVVNGRHELHVVSAAWTEGRITDPARAERPHAIPRGGRLHPLIIAANLTY